MRVSRVLIGVAVVASTLVACGGDSAPSGPPVGASAPTPTPAPAPTPSAEEVAASRAISAMLAIPSAQLDLASYPLYWLGQIHPFRANRNCDVSGTYEVTLNGSPLAPRDTLPEGMHAVVVQFQDCTTAGPWWNLFASGAAEVNYRGNVPGDMSAVVRMSGLRNLEYQSEGTATYSRRSAAGATQMVIEVSPGSSLTSIATTNRVEFLGGRFSYQSASGIPAITYSAYENFALELNGIRYTIDGRITWTHANTPQTPSSCVGQISIVDGNGGLMARNHCLDDGFMRSEVIRALPEFR